MGETATRCAKCGEVLQHDLVCVTWNVAAINNNPFEYWVTHDNAAYLELMEDVQTFIDKPTQEQDLEVGAVFSDAFFEELAEAMVAEGWSGVDETRELWKSDFSRRGIVSGFLKDKQLGAKRLASMPDRLTNTVSLASGAVVCRPTVVSNYIAPLPNISVWWTAWKAFMFEDKLEVPAKGGGSRLLRPCDLLMPISKAKYPAITDEEEAISVPLQALCCAIFDAILVHMLNTVATDTWHGVKADLCAALSTNKVDITLSILERQYADADAIFLQECASTFTDAIAKSQSLAEKFHILLPAAFDLKRDQNSLVLASRRIFRGSDAREVTEVVAAKVAETSGFSLSPGDLFAAVVPTHENDEQAAPFLLASFHGDTDGLLTVPVIDAICVVRESHGQPLPRLLFGLDANTYCVGVAGKKLGTAEFSEACTSRGLSECWSGNAAQSPYECCTTFNARTFLQPQLNKAVSRSAARADPNTDRNPKDYIVFDAKQLVPASPPERDNTGVRGIFDPTAPFPSLTFPSDHAALLSVLRPVGTTGAVAGRQKASKESCAGCRVEKRQSALSHVCCIA